MEPTSLKELTAGDSGESVEALLARADGVIAGLQGEFAEGTQARLDRLGELLRGGWAAKATREASVREMRRIAHDLKGEAGTFGFELMTEVADLFGAYLRGTPVARQGKDAVAGYIETLTFIWDERIEGGRDAAEPALLDRILRLQT
jgi:hypothetical protein